MNWFLKLVYVIGTLALCADVAEAQVRSARIGVVGAPEEPRFSEIVGGLKQGFQELGYAEKSVEILEGRVQRGKERDGESSVIEKLVRQNAQILLLLGSRLIKPARRVAPELPMIFITPGDPVAAGFVSTLSRPGGNVTALTFEYPELSAKRLQLLKEMIPGMRRVLALYDPRDESPKQGMAAAREIAPQLGITLLAREVQSAAEMKVELETLGDAEALLGVPGGIPTGYYREMIQLANARRIATMFHARTGSTMEALASYGTSDVLVARQAARTMDKILKGANAGEIPVERPVQIELVINLKIAKQTGITIPANVLLQAEKVIR